MDERVTLRSHLDRSTSQTPHGAAVGAVIEAIAAAAIELAALIADGPLAGITGRNGGINSDGDQQKDIDVIADELMRRALRAAPVAAVLSEEAALPEILHPEAPLCVAIDPLDGSSNIENNISVGTIFSIRPRGNDIISTFFEPGTAQVAAGFTVYGPQTTLVLALDARVDIFILDRAPGSSCWCGKPCRSRATRRNSPSTPPIAGTGTGRFAPISTTASPAPKGRGEVDFNMRWIGSLVAEAYRILVRGGVFLYPADARPSYRDGRLRLVYEAHPMALVIEQAGGSASTGRRRILELGANTLHQRVPLIMGSMRGVREVATVHEHTEPMFDNSDAPLFAQRGLFRLMGRPLMSRRHPIISITGSSGAGTTSVKQTFEQIFRRENVDAAYIEGDAFHRYDRAEMRAKMAEEAERGNKHFSHFSPEANLFEELEKAFRDYGETGTGDDAPLRPRRARGEAATAPAPGTFTEWGPLPENTDLLFYEGLHGAVVTDKVNVAQHADLKIGVVPVINLEWIQKLHRDRSARGYSDRGRDRHDPAAHARLRELHLPAVHRDRHQLPARADGRHLEPVHRALDPDAGRIDGGDPLLQNPRGIDFPYLLSMIPHSFMSRANSIVIPGGKLDLAMQLILTPLILQLIERKQAHDMNAPADHLRPRRATHRSLACAIWPMPSASSRWTPSRRRSPAIPACRWAWPTSRPCCSTRFLKFDPADPAWPDRDRFVLSAGHGSMLLYALLHLTGYDGMTLDELKRFRQWGSKTPGHPEYGHTPGVETTTGPLGQGIATAVGMALAERMMNARFGDDCVDHFTYVIAGDGCLMEGISHEAISLAGHLGLNRLIVLFDDNGISIDGPTSLSDLGRPARALRGLRLVGQPVDGHDPEAIAAAIERARNSDRPSLIACRTVIGYGAPNRQGTEKAHGAPLGADEIAEARDALNWPYQPFEIPEPVLDRVAQARCARPCRPPNWIERTRRLNSGPRSPFHDALNRRSAGGYARRDGAVARPLRGRAAEHCHPAGIADGARCNRASLAESARRLGRPDPLQPHAGQEPAAGAARRLRRQLHPLWHPRARHGGGDERHRAAWRLHPLWRHVSRLRRLQPPGDPARGADGPARHPRDDARLDRPRRGRADPSAGRASGVAARDPQPAGVPPGRRGRDRGGLGVRAAGARQPSVLCLSRQALPTFRDERERRQPGRARRLCRG